MIVSLFADQNNKNGKTKQLFLVKQKKRTFSKIKIGCLPFSTDFLQYMLFSGVVAGQSWFAQWFVPFTWNGSLQNSAFPPDELHCQHFKAYAEEHKKKTKSQWIFIYFRSFFILSDFSNERVINREILLYANLFQTKNHFVRNSTFCKFFAVRCSFAHVKLHSMHKYGMRMTMMILKLTKDNQT